MFLLPRIQIDLARTVLRCVVGLLLVGAALLKIDALVANVDKSHKTLHLPVWLIYGTVCVEVALGLWLLAQPMTRRTWTASVLLFLVFSGLSFYQGISGTDTCGCFGFLSVSPWLTFSLDTAVLCALFACRPPLFSQTTDGASSRVRIAFVVTTLFVLVALSLGVVTTGSIQHFDSARFRDDRQPPQTGDSPAQRSLKPNLAVILSSLGVRPIQPGSNEQRVQSLEEYLQHLVTTHRLQGVNLESIPATELVEFDQETVFDPPYVAKTASGRVPLVLGVYRDEEQLYYQLLDGPTGPRLISKGQFDEELVELWRYSSAARAEGDRHAQGISVVIGSATLNVDRLFHSFGLVRAYQSAATEFLFRNTGNSRLVLDNISVTCGCTHARFYNDAKYVNPGEFIKLSVGIDVGIEVATLRQSVTVLVRDATTNASDKITLDLLGSQLQTFKISSRDLNFGLADRDNSLVRTLRLSEVATDRFTVTSIEAGEMPIISKLLEHHQVNGNLRNYEIDLTIQPTALSEGVHNGIVRVNTNSKRLPYVDIRCTVQIPPLVQLQPKTMSIGNVRLGVQVTRTVTVKLLQDDESCNITAQNIEDSLFKVTEIVRTSPKEFRISIAFEASKLGFARQSCKLTAIAESWSKDLAVDCVAFVETNRLR